MLHVSIDSHTESLFGAFHEVASATAMHVHLNAARHYMATFRVYNFGSLDMQVAVGHGLDGVVLDD